VSELFTDKQARQAASHNLPELDCTLQSGARIINELDRVSVRPVNPAELADRDHVLESMLFSVLAIVGVFLHIPSRIKLSVYLDAFVYRNIIAKYFTSESIVTPARHAPRLGMPPRDPNIAEIVLITTVIATVTVGLRLPVVFIPKPVLIARNELALLLLAYFKKLSAG
jgi:hypothetical protein